jgi:DNA-binding CsgD family transcriptional regulator
MRPLERRVLKLLDAGVSDVEVARRFRRSPDMIRRVAAMAAFPRTVASGPGSPQRLRPLERRILAWRERGEPYDEIGTRFRRSPGHVERVEQLAHYKLGDPPTPTA